MLHRLGLQTCVSGLLILGMRLYPANICFDFASDCAPADGRRGSSGGHARGLLVQHLRCEGCLCFAADFSDSRPLAHIISECKHLHLPMCCDIVRKSLKHVCCAPIDSGHRLRAAAAGLERGAAGAAVWRAGGVHRPRQLCAGAGAGGTGEACCDYQYHLWASRIWAASSVQ